MQYPGDYSPGYCIEQVKKMCLIISCKYQHSLFPYQFCAANDVLCYIDYEYNDYMGEWNFENWGTKY